MVKQKKSKKKKRKRGRPITFRDRLHEYWREQKRRQRAKKNK